MNPRDIISKNMLFDHFDLIYDIEKSVGNYLFDSKYNRYLLDCFSFIATNPIGYNHLKMNEIEFERKLLKVAKVNPSNSDILTEEMASFVKTFVSLAVPKELPNLFFVAGGSVAVENALKTCFDYRMRKNWEKDITGVNPENLDMLHFKNAFHGRTSYALSLTNTFDTRKFKLFPKFKWTRINPPTIGSSCTDDKAINDIKESIKNREHLIAGIIIEPIQSEGGDNHFSKYFHEFLREITFKNDILLVYDEIQTGVGITGKMWAYQHYNIIPDIVVFGKKTQVCGIMCSNKIKEVPNNVFCEKSRLSSTFGGNLTDMVRCEKYLEIIKEDNLINNVEIVGEYFMEKLSYLNLDNLRGKGLMIAFDRKTQQDRDQFLKKLGQKMLAIPCGEKSVRFRPSLTFSLENVDQAIKFIKEVL